MAMVTLTFKFTDENEPGHLIVGLVLHASAHFLLSLYHDVVPFGRRKRRVELEYVVENFGIVFSSTCPFDFNLRNYTVLAGTTRAQDLVNTRPIGPILHDQSGVRPHFINIRSCHTCIRSTVFIL